MYNNFEQLFYRGELEQCIAQGENYLLSHPDHEDVLFLMAVAHHDRVYDEGHEEVYNAICDKVIPYLRRILKLNPNNLKALYNILDYPLSNEYTLMQIGRMKKHITEENRVEFITYAERLLDHIEYEAYGYDFLVKIYESLGENEALLNSLEGGIYYFQRAFADNRELRDKNTSLFWIKKVYLLDREKMIPGEKLITLIEEGQSTFVSRDDNDFINLADIAYENNAPDLSVKMMLKAIKGTNSLYIQEKLVEWHQRFAELIQNGYYHPDVFYYQLIIERNYADLLNISERFYYEHALEVITIHPELFSGYYFAGTYLYEEKSYAEAIPLLQKAVALSSNATAWRRKTESEYHLYKVIPAEIPVFSDLPGEIYNEGVYLNEFIENIQDENDTLLWTEVSRMVYEQAYKAFRRYYKQDQFDSDYYSDLHTRAMCCNNLAIKYSLQGDHYTSAAKASEGLTYSEFRELHFVLLDALLEGEDDEEAEAALNRYFSLYDEEDDRYFYKNLYYKARQIEVHCLLGCDNVYRNAEETLTYYYQHSMEHPEISDYDYRDLEAGKNILEEIMDQRLDNEDHITRQSYYEKVAERFPREPHPQYILMQLYNECEDYRKVAITAHKYLESKKDFMLDSFDRAKTIYMMVKSNYFHGAYPEAASAFGNHDAFNAEIMDTEDYVLWLSYGVRIYSKLDHKDQTLSLAERFFTIYNNEEWGYDKLMEGVELAKAAVLYKSGNLKEAHAILDHVCSFPDYDSIADEYRASWKKPGLFSKFGL
ncbi:hypothetical protein [Chryseobacterium sp.]|uniref:hypothetical protein n=1 Tax=Chryseobacterium sp. TaxID=1871047 RepID=UPI0024E2001B|nr:hypothetical protein [Chryseobacterium sp.]